MTKNEFVDAVASRTELTSAEARGAIEAIISAVSDELARGGEVTLAGFGKFNVSRRAARAGRNPSTGATINVSASRAAKFAPAAGLKGRLNPHASGKRPPGGAGRTKRALGSTPRVRSPGYGESSGGVAIGSGISVPPSGASRPVGSADQRFLVAEGPDNVPVGQVFSLIIRVALRGPGTEVELSVPPEGLPLLLVAYAPGLDAAAETRKTLIVPPDSDSDPVLFEFKAPGTGAYELKVSAWNAGDFVGEVVFEVIAEPDALTRASRRRQSSANLARRDGAVSLVVRFYPREDLYRFEFHDVDNPREVTGELTYDPAKGISDTLANLNALARATANYSVKATREYLMNVGIRLWTELIPETLREQFWARRSRIRELTIFTDNDRVPWELLYPMDGNHDHGFLVEQFPVMRGVFDRSPSDSLNLRPARFVLPEDSPATAASEITAIRDVLGLRATKSAVVTDLDALNSLLLRGNFGLLHFACHNDSSLGGSEAVILIGDLAFTPVMLAQARAKKALRRTKPLVFVNACGSANASPRYNCLDGWAEAFLEAGAAVFAGSLWEVRDDTAREFAQALYGSLKNDVSLGEAVMQARRAAANAPGDPTWLAYSVYGDANARLSDNNIQPVG